MDDALKQIWAFLGIPQVWGGVLTILCLAIAFLLKQLIDQLAEKRKSDREVVIAQFADVADFVKEQSVTLIKAYLRIFEGKDALDGEQFSEIVEKADNELMKPFRQFSAKLDDETKNKILHIHNVLAQYYPNASDAAIQAFKIRKVEFYKSIDETVNAIRPDLILKRLGIVSHPLRDRKKE